MQIIQKITLCLALLIVMGAGALTGCGVKPDAVDAPSGIHPDPFPRTYPPSQPAGMPDDSPTRYLPEAFQPDTPAPKKTPAQH